MTVICRENASQSAQRRLFAEVQSVSAILSLALQTFQP